MVGLWLGSSSNVSVRAYVRSGELADRELAGGLTG